MIWKNRFLNFFDKIIFSDRRVSLSLPDVKIISKIHSLIEDKFLYPVNSSSLSLSSLSILSFPYTQKTLPDLKCSSSLVINNFSINTVSYSTPTLSPIFCLVGLGLNSINLTVTKYDDGGNIIIED